jgi:hypothetical protein
MEHGEVSLLSKHDIIPVCYSIIILSSLGHCISSTILLAFPLAGSSLSSFKSRRGLIFFEDLKNNDGTSGG